MEESLEIWSPHKHPKSTYDRKVSQVTIRLYNFPAQIGKILTKPISSKMFLKHVLDVTVILRENACILTRAQRLLKYYDIDKITDDRGSHIHVLMYIRKHP